MIEVWVLTAIFFGGGFSMTPYPTEAACARAGSMLATEIVTEAACVHVEMIAPEHEGPAPRHAPIPPRKPGQSV